MKEYVSDGVIGTREEFDNKIDKVIQINQLIDLIKSQDLSPWTRGDDKESDRELIGERYEE